MSNEDPNSAPGWRNKLDELGHLPGSSFSSDAAWNRLYGRLRGNKKNKKIYWYWIAAACLLTGLIITVLNDNKTVSRAPNKAIAVRQEKELKKLVPKVEEVNTNKPANSAGREKDNVVASSNKNKSIQRKRRVLPTEVATRVQLNDAAYPQQEPGARPLQIINNNSTTSVASPKRKLNVVHINELGDPVPDMVGTDKHFKLKLANEEVYNPTTVYKNTDFRILKAKL